MLIWVPILLLISAVSNQSGQMMGLRLLAWVVSFLMFKLLSSCSFEISTQIHVIQIFHTSVPLALNTYYILSEDKFRTHVNSVMTISMLTFLIIVFQNKWINDLAILTCQIMFAVLLPGLKFGYEKVTYEFYLSYTGYIFVMAVILYSLDKMH